MSRHARAGATPSCCSSASTTPAGRRWRWAGSTIWPAGGPSPGRGARSRPTRSTPRRGRHGRGRHRHRPGVPKPWTDEIVRAADVVVTMGCGDACPFFPGTRYEDWALDDPHGQGIEAVRPIRDEIERRVRQAPRRPGGRHGGVIGSARGGPECSRLFQQPFGLTGVIGRWPRRSRRWGWFRLAGGRSRRNADQARAPIFDRGVGEDDLDLAVAEQVTRSAGGQGRNELGDLGGGEELPGHVEDQPLGLGRRELRILHGQ